MALILPLLLATAARADYQYAPTGFATMTHYDLPLDYVASCGCAPASTHYPTVALSQLAFGSSVAFGPGCGRCFNLTLLNTFLSTPPFYPPKSKSIIVKVTDQCPGSSTWCTATADKPNDAGHFLNFDLAFPSKAIPSDFFPSDVPLYGYADFGVWNISYAEVSCTPNWAGHSNPKAMGSVTNLGDSTCCPGDVTANLTCPSFSEKNGIPPDTSIGGAVSARSLAFGALWTMLLSGGLSVWWII